jgi:peptidoglycan hydrolase-like protein with peptidoglycan-binding domain
MDTPLELHRYTRSGLLVRAVAGIIAGVGMACASIGYAHEPESTPISDEARTLTSQLFASPSQVRLVQEKLREKGYEVADQVDGVWGDATSAAVKRFQKANGLADTGQLDTSLLSALEIGDVLEGETSSKFLDGLLQADASGTDGKGYGAPLFVSPAHVAQIQHVLADRGFYDGAVDGVWGEATATAANEYRTSLGLEKSTGIDVSLLRALNQQRTEVPKEASTTMARTNGVPLYAGPETLRAMQRELSAEGHDAGAIDGEWGENTREALRSFQRERDLEATGTLTLPTLAALGIDIKNEGDHAFESRARTGTPPTESEPTAVAEEGRD